MINWGPKSIICVKCYSGDIHWRHAFLGETQSIKWKGSLNILNSKRNNISIKQSVYLSKCITNVSGLDKNKAIKSENLPTITTLNNYYYLYRKVLLLKQLFCIIFSIYPRHLTPSRSDESFIAGNKEVYWDICSFYSTKKLSLRSHFSNRCWFNRQHLFFRLVPISRQYYIDNYLYRDIIFDKWHRINSLQVFPKMSSNNVEKKSLFYPPNA